jgi:GTP pyrophosphokinase
MLRQYELVERVKAYDPDADEAMLNRAYVYTVQKHGSQKRASGDPYFSHPVEVAGLMTDLKFDQETIITALLHDTVEDTLATIEDIEANFGPAVARLVDGVTKLSKIETMAENERAAENLRKFLLAMSEDIRVLLVKLADRLHNMRTLHFIKSPDKRRRIARETMEIYAPLAERVGMYEYMREMQALAFEQLEPEAYATLTGRLEQLRSQDHGQVDAIALAMKQALAGAGVQVQVWGREKQPYSIWKKMAERHVSFEQVTDIMAFRIITQSEADCYRALGVLHTTWQFIPGRFKDYISTPKTNGYRSLHTSLIYENSMRVEVQIRTGEMHRLNEFGLAAHWAYKQGDRPDGQVGWLRDLIEIVDASHDAEELLEHTKMAIYQDRIFAFTPKGALFQLPKGSTPVDFAFAVHTDLGGHTVGAKINGRHMPLRTPLNNGDVVEIIKGASAEPQLSWLSFVVTGKARAAIRRAVRAKERAEVASIGRKLFDEIAERLPAKVGDPRCRRAAWPGRGRPDARDRRRQAGRSRGDGGARPRQHRRSAGRADGARQGHLYQGLDLRPRVLAIHLLPPCARRPDRRHPAEGGRGAGAHNRLPRPGQRNRCRLGGPVMGRTLTGCAGSLASGALQPPGHAGGDGRHLRQELRQRARPRPHPARRPVPHLRGGYRGAGPRAPHPHRQLAARQRRDCTGGADLMRG